MTKDEIIEMANQAELCQCIWIDDEGPEIASLVAFAKLVEERFMDKLIAHPSICRQIIDAGVLSSNPAGFKARGLKTK